MSGGLSASALAAHFGFIAASPRVLESQLVSLVADRRHPCEDNARELLALHLDVHGNPATTRVVHGRNGEYVVAGFHKWSDISEDNRPCSVVNVAGYCCAIQIDAMVIIRGGQYRHTLDSISVWHRDDASKIAGSSLRSTW